MTPTPHAAVAWGRAHRDLAQLVAAGVRLSGSEARDLDRTGQQAWGRARAPSDRSHVLHWAGVRHYVRQAELYARLRRGDLPARDYWRLMAGAHPTAESLDRYVPAGSGGSGSGFGSANVLFRWNEDDLSQFDTGNVVTTTNPPASGDSQSVTWSYEAASATELTARIRGTQTWVVGSGGGSYLPIAAASMADLATPSSAHARAVVFIRYACITKPGGAEATWVGFAQTNGVNTVGGLYGICGVLQSAAAGGAAKYGNMQGTVAASLATAPFNIDAMTAVDLVPVSTNAAPAMGHSCQLIFDTHCPGGSDKPIARMETRPFGGLIGSTYAGRAPFDMTGYGLGVTSLVGTDASWDGVLLPRMGLVAHSRSNPVGVDNYEEFADLVIFKHWMDWA